MILWKKLRECLLNHPAQTLQDQEASITYEELVVYAEILAKKLVGQTCCAIYCHSEMAAAMALLGCFAAEVTAVPVSPRYGKAHCSKILRWISPTCVVTDRYGDLGVYYIEDSSYCVPEKSPALILCTSGTTGHPKGVMLSEENILCNLADIARYFKVTANDSILISRPLYHGAVLTGEFLLALIKGLHIVFYSEPFNPVKILELLKKSQATTFGTTPSLARTMFRFYRENNEIALKNLVISGECLNDATAESIREAIPDAHIYHVYGLTEACPRVSCLPPEEFAAHPTSAGYPLQSIKLSVRDGKRSLPPGEAGMLWVKGNNVMMGYYNDPVLTERTLVNGWLRTGDMAKIDEDGLLYILGRADDKIIRAGMNIYPQEIEAELKKDPRTNEVLVYGIKDAKTGVQIAMKIAGQYDTVESVRKLCVDCLPPYQVPTHIELVDSLPKNGTGKVIRGRQHG